MLNAIFPLGVRPNHKKPGETGSYDKAQRHGIKDRLKSKAISQITGDRCGGRTHTEYKKKMYPVTKALSVFREVTCDEIVLDRLGREKEEGIKDG